MPVKAEVQKRAISYATHTAAQLATCTVASKRLVFSLHVALPVVFQETNGTVAEYRDSALFALGYLWQTCNRLASRANRGEAGIRL